MCLVMTGWSLESGGIIQLRSVILRNTIDLNKDPSDFADNYDYRDNHPF